MSVKKRGELSNGLPPDEESGGGGYETRPDDLDLEPRPANGLDRATELELIDTALLDNIDAFSELFEHYRPDLYTLCHQRLNDPSLAEDVVQDVFLKAFASLPNSDHRKPIWPWLATIALRMCVDLQRRRSFIHYSGDIGASMDTSAHKRALGRTDSALDEVIASEDREKLWRSVDVLPERQRRALLFYALDGMSYEDIAAAEGITVGAVKLLLVRARRKIRKVTRGGPLPAIIFPFTWLRWKLQRIEERIRPLLGYGESFSTACAQAACLGTVAMVVVAMSLPSMPFDGNEVVPSGEAVLLATQSGPLQTASRQTALPTIGAPAPAEPQQTVTGPASSLVDGVINPNQNATPEDMTLHSLTVSPNYESDHTILAVGYSPQAFVLFASNDGGATWKPRPSLLLNGATMVLPPDFPRDGRIFTYGSVLGLQQSDDGGAVFRTVSPALGWALAISPSFGKGGSIGGGDSKILMGEKTVFEYDAATGVTKPASLAVPPVPEGYSSIAFSPSYQSDSTVFVADNRGDAYRCKGLFCDAMPRLAAGTPRFRFSPQCHQQGLAYIFTPFQLLVSKDGGRTFGKAQFPVEFQSPYSRSRSIYDMAVLCNGSSDPAIFVSFIDDYAFSPQFPSGIYRSFDAGGSWTKTSIDLPEFGPAAKELIVTPTGRLLATGSQYGSRGIACSTDEGKTWTRRCPPEKQGLWDYANE